MLHIGDLKADGQRAIAAVTKRSCKSVKGYAGMLCEESNVLQQYSKNADVGNSQANVHVLQPQHCSTTADGGRMCEERKLKRFWLPSLK